MLDNYSLIPFHQDVIDTLAILAPGLLGASVARAAKARGAARRVVIWARRPEVRLALADQPWCDEVADSAETAVAEAHVVVIATPVTRMAEIVDRIAPHLIAGAVVTDVGSVKAEICRHGTTTLAPTGATFVGSHPMAGSEKTGWTHADPELFAGKTCFVTPRENDDAVATETVVRLWRDLGAEVVSVGADEHDEIVAHISHLPQIIATNLGTLLGTRPAQWSQLAGNGLKDTTRIAASDATMWIEILEQNRDEILRSLDAFENDLHQFRAALSNRDWTDLRTRLERGKSWRDGLRP
ncbi:prephenate dehydrogenase/arogenate dehydrogenase family protein [Opitutaceae bacterium]|jgi:prephenate dehydrogenase|nr:prephenate dehydrogenase/arogenate dehydrogenase family protein [Opitutaceae bacterium]